MRICFVGSGRSVHHPARARPFAERGHDVRLVAVGEGDAAETLASTDPASDARLEIVRIRPPRAGSPIEGVRAARALIAAIRSFRPDVLHAHYAGPLATVAALSGIRPFVVTVMGGDVLFEQHERPTRRQRRAARRLLERADLVLAKSEPLADTVRAMGDFAAKTHTVVWGVDLRRFDAGPSRAEARTRWALGPGQRVILSPRILQPLYNVHQLVEALPAVIEVCPEAILVVTEYAADEPYRRRVQSRITELGMEGRVRFLGTVPAVEMPSLYRAADVVASIPFSDGLPQSVFEAMASQVPVVVGDLPAYDGVLVDGETAVRVSLEPAAIAQGLLRVLGDPVLAACLAAAGRTMVVEHADLRANAERVEALYRDLLSHPRPTPARGWLSGVLDAGALLLG
jgi:glycosyltransferase involved in cell wall biosynthesis